MVPGLRKAGEARQFRQRHVHPEGRRFALPAGHPPRNLGGHGAFGDKPIEQEFGIDPRGHGLGSKGGSPSDHAGRFAFLDDDLLYRAVQDDLDPDLGTGFGHRLGDRPHAANRMSPGAFDSRRLAEDMMKQDVGRSRGIRTGIMADDGVEPEQGLDQFVAEISAEHVRGRLGEEVDQMTLILEAEPVHASAQLEQRKHVAQAAAGIGRCAKQPLANYSDDGVQGARIVIVILGIRRAVTGDLPPGEAASAAQYMFGPLGRKKVVDPAKHHLETVLVKPHVADDRGVEQPNRVARRGVAKTRMKFLGDGGAPDDVTRFQDGHLQAVPSQIEGANETIMARANDQNVVVTPPHRSSLYRAGGRPASGRPTEEGNYPLQGRQSRNHGSRKRRPGLKKTAGVEAGKLIAL